MSTVDEIIASGRYIDRRGRGWDYVETVTSWCSPEFDHEDHVWGCRYLDTAQMRLLIERDQHRDECRGLWRCKNHPVMRVVGSRIFRGGMTHVMPATGDFYVFRDDDGGCEYWSLPAAMDAARALAVGA